MKRQPGPFPVIENNGDGHVDNPMSAPKRRYMCENYQSCLEVAAGLNWDNFTCRGCSGEVDETLIWRACSAKRNDKVARRILSISPSTEDSSSENNKVISISSKRCA